MSRGVLLLVLMLGGCAMKVSGFVSDALTGRPIGGARVRIDDRIVYANPVGTYIVKVHGSSTATAEVSAPGYDTSTVKCATPGRHPVCDVVLHPVVRDQVPVPPN